MAAALVAHPGVIAPPLVHNYTAGGMVALYRNAILWANAQGTYSNEFHYVRDNQDSARNLLNNAGMDLNSAQQFVDNFAAQIRARPGSEVGYVRANVQMQIFRALGIGEQLIAIIRYLRNGQN